MRYFTAGELDNARKALKWQTDFTLKCFRGGSTPATLEFVGQVGNGNYEHSAFWGRAGERGEIMKKKEE